MKKILVGLIIFFISPFMVIADEVDYDITDFLVQSYILENGDLKVQELIVLDGNFNGYERDIMYANSKLESGNNFDNNAIYNASDIKNMDIKAKYVDSVSYNTFNDNDFMQFVMGSAVNGDKGKYLISKISNGYRYRMYYKSSNQKVAFLLSYVVDKAVVLHEDVAELYWTFIPDGFQDKLNNINIQVFLPSEDKSDNFRIWAHGNLSGEVNKINNTGVKANISEVFNGESVDVRLTFNKSLITDTSKIKRSGKTALESIIEVETVRANEANKLRENLLMKYNFVKYSSLAMYGIISLLFVFVYFKYGKSPKSSYFSKYNREFIDDYNVEIIDYLMNKKITPNAMSASIMNLIYKKNISVTELESKGKKKDYEFTLENTKNINESEKILIEFLFDKVSKRIDSSEKKVFSTIELKKYADGTKTCDTFISSYTKWKNNILNISKKENFYEKSSVPSFIGVFITFIVGLIFIMALNYGVDFIPTYLLLFLVIVFLIYCLLVDKKTSKGSLHYDKWNAFKNFLKDFGTFDLKELPEIVLWERYLVYATVFGLADKVSKNMNVRINEIDVSSMGYDYYPTFIYFNIGHSINSSINNAISTAYNRQSANYANSHSSSSSGGGFGGGFSSGGGFGGGGGGGRGF